MNKLLSKKTNQLLYLVHATFETTLSVEQALVDLKCSEVLLATLISDVNQIIAPAAVISANKTLSLNEPAQMSYDLCVSKILAESLEVTIIETLFFEEEHSYLTLAHALYSSESTIRRTISSLRAVLGEHGIEIKTKPLRLAGNERLIRLLLFRLFSEKYGLCASPFSQAEKSFIASFLDIKIPIFTTKYSYSPQDRHFVTMFSLISLHRYKNGHQINRTNQSRLTKIATFFEKKLPAYEKRVIMKKTSVLDYVSNVFYLFLSSEFLHVGGGKKVKENKAKVHVFIEQLQKDLAYQLTSKDQKTLESKVYNCIYGFLSLNSADVALTMDNNHYFSFYKNNQMHAKIDKADFRKKYQTMFGESLSIYAEAVYYYLEIYFYAPVKNPLKVGVLIDFDNDFSNYLLRLLSARFSNNFTFIDISEAEDSDKNTMDLTTIDICITNVLSNIPLATNDIYRISKYISEQEIKKISLWLIEHLNENKP